MVRRVIGALIFLTGTVWFLQGIGVRIGDSFMIESTTWVIVGAIVALVGLVLVLAPRASRRG